MPLTIPQLLNSYRKRTVDSEEGFSHALETSDFGLAVSNTKSLFNEQVMLGLLSWKQETNPSSEFKAAVIGLTEIVALLSNQWPQKNPLPMLPAAPCGYLAYLVDLDSTIGGHEGQDGTRNADLFLARCVLDRASIRDWHIYASSLRDEGPHHLANRTLQLYAKLLSWEIPSEEGVRTGERLFTLREADTFYRDASGLEGGGGYNDKVVDFRLAAILKKIGSTVPTIHAWKW